MLLNYNSIFVHNRASPLTASSTPFFLFLFLPPRLCCSVSVAAAAAAAAAEGDDDPDFSAAVVGRNSHQ